MALTNGKEAMSEVEAGLNELTIDALVHAVQFGDFPSVEMAIDQQKLSPDSIDRQGCSLLHWAAINNRIEIARYLISKNCNINMIGGDNGEIPLQWAVRNAQCTAMVDLLLQEGSNLHHKSLFGYDALFVAVLAGQIHIAFVLLYHGANPNTMDLHQETLLSWLLKNQFSDGIEYIRLLLKFGADPSIKGPGGNNCLHVLVEQGKDADFNVALTVYGNGAPALIEALNEAGYTPYGLATKLRNSRFMRFLFDAYMFTHFPKSLPIIVIANSFFLTFVLYLFYGWFYGSAFVGILWLLSSLLHQSTIFVGGSRYSCGWAWGVIITVASSYYYFISPYFAPNHDPYFSSSMDYFIGVTLSLIAYTLYKSMYTVPQHLVCEDSIERKRIVEKIIAAKPILNTKGAAIGIDFRLCVTCCTDKSLASIHCSKCNICVVQLDHHCPFVNNCVGRGNRRIFVLFTLFAGFGCILVASLTNYIQQHYLCSEATGWLWGFFAVQSCSFSQLPVFTVIGWLAGFVGFWIVCICLGQLNLVATEMTTFEIIKNRAKAGVSCCSLKAIQNIQLFCQTGQYIVNEYVGKVAAECDCGHDHHQKNDMKHHGDHHHHSPKYQTNIMQSNSIKETAGSDQSYWR